MKTKKHIQHGDVSFHAIEELPAELKPIKHNGEYVLVEGEKTGHCHRLKGKFELFTDKDGNYYIKNQESAIEHWDKNTNQLAEHATKPLTMPFYIVKRENEFSPFNEEILKASD